MYLLCGFKQKQRERYYKHFISQGQFLIWYSRGKKLHISNKNTITFNKLVIHVKITVPNKYNYVNQNHKLRRNREKELRCTDARK